MKIIDCIRTMSFPWIFSPLILIAIFHAGYAVLCGSIAQEGQFKYLVKISRKNEESIRSCTGAIIGSSHILTAAHCVFGLLSTELTVTAGMVHLRSRSLIDRKVAKIHIHPKYRFQGSECGQWGRFEKWFLRIWEYIKNEQGIYRMQNDIAVLTLDKALPVRNDIQIVNLPALDFLPYCEYCEYAGWGYIDEDGRIPMRLRWMEMIILIPEDCDDFDARHYSNQFCAIDPEMTSCPLAGDSGSPLVFNNTVIGVTSNGCCAPEAPTIFSNVFDHLDFIRKALTD